MEIEEYQLVNGECKVTYSNGYVEYLPEKVFEKTDEYRRYRFKQAKDEFVNSLLGSPIGKFLYKILDKLNLLISNS